MHYIEIGLRKTNLVMIVNEWLDSLQILFKKEDKRAVKEADELAEETRNYYTKAPKRNGKNTTISRELTARGNLW